MHLFQMTIFSVSQTVTAISKVWYWVISLHTSTGLAATAIKPCRRSREAIHKRKISWKISWKFFWHLILIVNYPFSPHFPSIGIFKKISSVNCPQTSCGQCGTVTATTHPRREFHTTLVVETQEEEIKEVKNLLKWNVIFAKKILISFDISFDIIYCRYSHSDPSSRSSIQKKILTILKASMA